MKIEKVNERQIRCTLTKNDLTSRNLKMSELAYGTDKAKNLFRDMMREAESRFGFEVEDIPLMAAKFLREFSQENNKSVTGLERSTLELLQKYPWPGNVRELRACMEHAVIFSSGSSVQVRDLPPSIKNWQPETVMIGAPLMPSTDAHPSQTPAHSVKKTSNLSVKEA
ncbi:MAG: adaptor protein MecA, partial [Lachnospiraceae bacterium]|nr:adaptor protein MecA [Lachnospiraceae bacterium]